MKLRIGENSMEDIEGLESAYPYVCHRVDLAATAVPWHWHEALEFGYVVSGSMKVTTVDGCVEFRQGQGFFMNSNVLSTMERQGDCVLESHLFHPIFLGGHFNSVFETKYLHPVTRNRHIELVALTGENAVQRRVLQKLEKLAQLQTERDTEFQTRNLLSEIWLLILEEIRQRGEEKPAVNRQSRDRILTMMAFVRENFREKLSLEEIAASAAVSTRECLRCFRQSIGQSPMEYLIACRVEEGAKLLEQTRLSVTEIAMQTGFGSAAYFSKLFRRQTGKTPGEYRKEKRRQ